MADHRISCHLCGKLDAHGPTRVRGLIVLSFCRQCHATRRGECEDLMRRANGEPALLPPRELTRRDGIDAEIEIDGLIV